MNNLNNLISNPNLKKFLLPAIFILFVLITFVLSFNPKAKSRSSQSTVPVIPTKSTSQTTPTLDTKNTINPTQKITFNWGNLSPSIPSTITAVSISTPLVNANTITDTAGKFAFTDKDKATNLSSGDYLWSNNLHTLFGSLNQNQISYFTASELPKHTNNISQDAAINSARNVIANLFGQTFSSSLQVTEVRYLIHLPNEVEVEPKNSTIDTANVIVVDFSQQIDSIPVITRSRKGEIVSVALDTTSKLYSMTTYGGLLDTQKTKDTPLLDFSEIQKLAPTTNIRISHSQNIGSERGYSDAKTINVVVKSLELGYFQDKDNSLFPVFIVKGNMSAAGLEPYPAIYIIPATANSITPTPTN